MTFLLHCLAALLALTSAVTAQSWKPLWDGKSFDGWHIIGRGDWKIENGTIMGEHAREEKEFAHLVADAVYRDFTLRLKFKAVAGNSGLYFRIEESGFSGVSGFQAEIDAQNDVGGLYETNGRAWVVRPTPQQVRSWFKAGEWNEMTISARGPKLIVQVNGKTSAEIDDPKGRAQGRLALQLHGGQDVLVYFKDLQIDGEPIAE